MKKVAFYAAIKPPDHPIPSGDRLIAGNLMEALERAGFAPFLASRFISYSKRHASDILEERKAAAHKEIERLKQELASVPPDLWLTYHPYCKAPDWLGPSLSAHFGIPYVTVEAAQTGQGREDGQDLWKEWRKEAQAGIVKADLHLVLKPSDQAFLTGLLGSSAKLSPLRPFADLDIASDLPEVKMPSHWREDVPIIVTTGLMRPGKKVENYRLLAKALFPLQGLPWNLVLIGGGPEEETIQGFFRDIAGERLWWTGLIDRDEVLSIMRRGTIFCWPGWREPIGMVYLEAQACGLPVVAMDSLGVPLVVEHGVSGLLAPECGPSEEPAGLSDALSIVLSHPKLRRDLAENAKARVQNVHSLDAAADTLRKQLNLLL